ncbi:LCP family protein [Kitasatospora sp. CM 4170]|uniref:LCP family protein n=1 Tax=Kitasatospora TaxID=2063 RepID=UPI0028ABA3EF|nr:LCP family protein [Kitasatospora sp. CM 4170]WNM43434.1 LCP family protein [Kitasatospora sp. CM 4170]
MTRSADLAPADSSDSPDSAGHPPEGAIPSPSGTDRTARRRADDRDQGRNQSRNQGRGRTGRRRRKTGWRRWLKPIALTLGLVVLACCGGAYLYYRHLNANLQVGSRNLSDAQGAKTAPNAAGQTPLNILVIGTDSRGSAANVALGGGADDAGRAGLADVQMLVHISADRSNASMVTVPRDTMVAVPACHSEDGKQTFPAEKRLQINSTLTRGGAGCVVGTWISLTGLEIDHYLMVDFAGVVTMADAVGGVPVCVTMNMYDRQIPGIGGTGLKLPKGETTIQGEQALQWLRVRDAWGPDLGRARAQHMYLSSLMRQLKKKGSLTDPGSLMKLAEAATKSLSVDRGLADIKKLYDLGNELKGIPTERTTSLTVPVLEDPKDRNRLVLQKADTDNIWKMLGQDLPLDGKGASPATPSPEASAPASAAPSTAPGTAPAGPAPDTGPSRDSVAVIVQNATTVANRATDVKAALVAAGFTKAATAGGGGSRATTTLTYGKGQLAQAKAVATAVGLPETALKEAGTAKSVALVIGADWPTGTTFPAPGANPPPAQSAPTSLPTSVDAETADNDKDCMTVNPQGGRYTY